MAKVLMLMRQLRPVSFRYKENSESKYSRYGFIAQELEAFMPSLIYTSDSDEGNYKYVRYHDLLAVLTVGLQSLDAYIDNVSSSVDALDELIESDYETLSNGKLKYYEDALIKKIAEIIAKNNVDQVQMDHPSFTHGTNNATTTTNSSSSSLSDSLNDDDVEIDDLSLLEELEDLVGSGTSNEGTSDFEIRDGHRTRGPH
jgi:hypothetical protein